MRLVLISDTHCQEDHIDVPEGDVLIHAGDFLYFGQQDVVKFGAFLARQPHPYKLVIGGNHDDKFALYPKTARAELQDGYFGISYLQDEEISINGVKFYGTPWQPYWHGMAFNLKQDELRTAWRRIPYDTNVLITHCPPLTFLDEVHHENWVNGGVEFVRENVGCVELLKRVKELEALQLHVFGHIHVGYGQVDLRPDGPVFVNASLCAENHVLKNEPIVIDL